MSHFKQIFLHKEQIPTTNPTPSAPNTMPQSPDQHQEILSYAARLVVEEGASYHHAKQQAIRQLGLSPRTPLPGNDALEDAVIQHIALFHADTQPLELKKLRQLALKWMLQMADFSPYLSGAIWHGTATQLSDIHIQLFCNDPKAVEIHLINKNISYTAAEIKGIHKEMVYTLCAAETVPEWRQQILIYLSIYNTDDLRGALTPDTKGRPPRGNIPALQKLLSTPPFTQK